LGIFSTGKEKEDNTGFFMWWVRIEEVIGARIELI
jgi:hypothetical protein